MENLVIFRMFLCFPLVGFLVPDFVIWMSSTTEPIPVAHIVIEAILVFCIAVCTAWIMVLKKRQNNESNSDGNSALEI